MPFIIYLAFGYLLRRIGILESGQAKKINRIIFRGFFPVMMFRSMYSMDRNQGLRPEFIAIMILSVCAVILLGILIVPRFVQEDGRRGVIIQGLYRSNVVLFAIPLTTSVLGEEAGHLSAMMLAAVVPLYNLAAVFLLSHYGHTSGGNFKERILDIIRNPLISGTIVGLIFWVPGIRLPAVVMAPINAVADMSTPLAIIILGATIRFASVRKNLKYHAAVITVKMIAVPLVLLGLSLALGLSSFERFLLIMIFAVPVATASFNMAFSMNCDGDLAGEIVVTTTVVSVATLFLWIFSLNYFGFI